MSEWSAEDQQDRYGHNGHFPPRFSRIIYMTNAKGYVMARRPYAMPFVITTKLWLSFEVWKEQE